MSERERYILQLVIEDVVRTSEPVGSQYLVEKYDLDISSATVRNVFMLLEQRGYLTHPHTSAGRIPTEKGYRFYLQELMRYRELRAREQLALKNAQSFDALARTVAEMTSSILMIMNSSTRVPYKTGFSYLLAQPEFSDSALLSRVGAMLDDLGEIVGRLDVSAFSSPTALIGPECPFGEHCGSVFVRLPNGGIAGVLGPIRMDYARAYSVLNDAKDLFDEFDTYDE